jgi:hypothetical protein
MGVSPRPPTTTTATSVLITRAGYLCSKVAKRTDSYSGCGRIAFARCRQIDRHSPTCLRASPARGGPFGGAFLRGACSQLKRALALLKRLIGEETKRSISSRTPVPTILPGLQNHRSFKPFCRKSVACSCWLAKRSHSSAILSNAERSFPGRRSRAMKWSHGQAADTAPLRSSQPVLLVSGGGGGETRSCSSKKCALDGGPG